MENKVLIQGNVIEVTKTEETDRMLDIYNIKICKADGSEVNVECEADGLEERLLPRTKIVVLGHREGDKIVAKTMNY